MNKPGQFLLYIINSKVCIIKYVLYGFRLKTIPFHEPLWVICGILTNWCNTPLIKHTSFLIIITLVYVY